MIAEEYNYHQNPRISIPKGKTISVIVQVLKQVHDFFILALKDDSILKPLNEDKLTQILVEQINALLLEQEFPIQALPQYQDIYLGSKGKPDFYFTEIEKGKTNKPLFIVESKILPAPPPKERKKEYVIGVKKNGGIERYKIEKHGKGLNECGLIGFIKENEFEYWQTQINVWIDEIAIDNSFWNIDEKIKIRENKTNFAFLQSIARRQNTDDLTLYHFWINTSDKKM